MVSRLAPGLSTETEMPPCWPSAEKSHSPYTFYRDGLIPLTYQITNLSLNRTLRANYVDKKHLLFSVIQNVGPVIWDWPPSLFL